MAINKLTTQSYFIKRLKDSGYVVYKLFDEYSDVDPRKWTIIIDPKGASLFCTCYENYDELDKSFFEFHDGGQFVPYKLKITTDSLEVVLEYLNNFNIINKHVSYNNK